MYIHIYIYIYIYIYTYIHIAKPAGFEPAPAVRGPSRPRGADDYTHFRLYYGSEYI